MKLLFLLCVLVFTGVSDLARAAGSTDGARAMLDRALRGAKDASTTFRQTRRTALGTDESSGTLEYARTRRLRIEWKGKIAATAWVRGDTLWYWQPATKQVVRSNAAIGGAGPALFLAESTDALERTCRIQSTGPSSLALLPKPDGEATFQRADLVLDPSTGWPKRLAIVGADGDTTRLSFGPFRVNRGIAGARFVPSVPKGVEVIEW